MSDLQDYINKRKQNDSEFADNYDIGYDNFKIGIVLRQMRQESGYTQEELANKLNTKKSVISRIENHAEDIRLSTLNKYAEMLGRSLKIQFIINKYMLEKIKQTVKFLKEKGIYSPEIGIVLGTGLGKLINEINIDMVIEYTDIPHFPVATVESHSGKLIYGKMKDKIIIAMQGRFHYYEGYNMQEITFPIRVMKLLIPLL